MLVSDWIWKIGSPWGSRMWISRIFLSIEIPWLFNKNDANRYFSTFGSRMWVCESRMHVLFVKTAEKRNSFASRKMRASGVNLSAL